MTVDVSGVEACTDGLEAAVEGLQRQAESAAKEIAELIQEYAKQNHPWQNRTGQTQATTKAFIAESSEQLVLIALTTETDYSIFLELAKSGKWSWLWPAIEANTEQILRILQHHLQNARLL